MSNFKEKWIEIRKDKKKFAAFLLLLFLATCSTGVIVMKGLGAFDKKDNSTAENNLPTPNSDSTKTNNDKLAVYTNDLKQEEENLNQKNTDQKDFEKILNGGKDNGGNTSKTDYSSFGKGKEDYLVKNGGNDTKSTDNNTNTTNTTNNTVKTRTRGTTTQDAIVYSQNQMSAVIHNWGREIRSGSNVRIRTTESFKANGISIPENTILYGTASANGERMSMNITGANLNKEVVPLNLEVYDNDGVAGIHIPSHLQREVANDVVNNVTENTKTTVKLGTLGEVTTGIGKKTKDNPNIIVSDGYRIFLKPRKN